MFQPNTTASATPITSERCNPPSAGTGARHFLPWDFGILNIAAGQLVNQRLFVNSLELDRQPVVLETYNTVKVRDVSVESVRQESNWLLNVGLHCETARRGAQHNGTWQISLVDARGLLIQQLISQATLIGDVDREAFVPFQFTVAAHQVPSSLSIKFFYCFTVSPVSFFLFLVFYFLQIDPWMPSGYGNQTLYKLNINYVEDNLQVANKSIQFGFRTVELIDEPLNTGGNSFFVRVNQVPIFLKGSNWIPAAITPELVTRDYIRVLLTACKDANMNALRVWGGGMYEFQALYEVISIQMFHKSCRSLFIFNFKKLITADS